MIIAGLMLSGFQDKPEDKPGIIYTYSTQIQHQKLLDDDYFSVDDKDSILCPEPYQFYAESAVQKYQITNINSVDKRITDNGRTERNYDNLETEDKEEVYLAFICHSKDIGFTSHLHKSMEVINNALPEGWFNAGHTVLNQKNIALSATKAGFIDQGTKWDCPDGFQGFHTEFVRHKVDAPLKDFNGSIKDFIPKSDNIIATEKSVAFGCRTDGTEAFQFESK
ncbi:hypothetical protein [Kordiimonas sp. SCSIO 12610]|uniref:hypothetical protein n=1 Tax=Kordiimonas sp. SCSIO 12610 TaxID=2829597 RepID=UPI0021097E69|nr:hypothetical protein [Kordiimonas sp. SCSIO 12610]UTW55971.1 hypothetical protein KFF44_03510 [Kordiimonas sp. SCSIO 12610]